MPTFGFIGRNTEIERLLSVFQVLFFQLLRVEVATYHQNMEDSLHGGLSAGARDESDVLLGEPVHLNRDWGGSPLFCTSCPSRIRHEQDSRLRGIGP